MSKKDCGNHDNYWSCGCKIKKHKRLLCGLAIFIFIVLLIILIVWLALRPTKPRYYLQDAIVYNLNTTGNGPSFLTTTMQVTLKSHNPNGNIGIYYDKLDVYAVYKGQQITVPTELPQGYQGHDDINIWSPYLYGTDVPLAQYLMVAFNEDQSAGYLLINVLVSGRLRWKVGTWVSGHYHINVKCSAFLSVNGNGLNGYGYRYQPNVPDCTVDV